MRGDDQQLQSRMFSHMAVEDRIPADHSLRGVRRLVDAVFVAMSKDLDRLYSEVGRRSIAPERLLRALLLQVFYSVPQRAAADGAAQLEPVVPLVRRLGDRRRGVEPRGDQQKSGSAVGPGSGRTFPHR
jgi:hypothetical protein